jgi:hypothetical protein
VTRHAYLNTKGALLCRAGRYAEAIDVLKAGIAVEGSQPLPHDAFLLALAYQRLHRNDEAKTWMDRGLQLLGPEPSGGDLWGNLELQLLKEEATRALKR